MLVVVLLVAFLRSGGLSRVEQSARQALQASARAGQLQQHADANASYAHANGSIITQPVGASTLDAVLLAVAWIYKLPIAAGLTYNISRYLMIIVCLTVNVWNATGDCQSPQLSPYDWPIPLLLQDTVIFAVIWWVGPERVVPMLMQAILSILAESLKK